MSVLKISAFFLVLFTFPDAAFACSWEDEHRVIEPALTWDEFLVGLIGFLGNNSILSHLYVQ